MGESNHQASSATRVGMRGAGGGAGGGEIVEVQGGHIVRSTGRKDRHSKVCTAKGTRDRRVRLSAHTAIQFYDVQDRLGYDRPSKAVDWLIKKAKAAIDELAELPAWDPTTVANTVANRTTKNTSSKSKYEKEYQFVGDGIGSGSSGSNIKVSNSNPSSGDMYSGDISSMHVHQQQQQQQIGGENPNHTSGLGLLPGSLESDSIADAFKSYFPMGKSTESATTTINFENYPPDLLSRTNSQSQDLRLSLQSLQEPILLHQQSHGHNESRQNGQQVLLPGATAAHHPVFDVSGWSEHNHRNPQELGRFQRIAAWNASGGADTSGSGNGCAVSNGGFLFNLPPPSPAQTPPIAAQQAVLQPFFGQNQFFTQRGPLQSSNTPSIRAWIDPANAIDSNYDMQQVHQYHQAIYNGIGSASTPHNSIGGFSGFQIPARIQGEEEEHGGLLNKPSSASSKIRR